MPDFPTRAIILAAGLGLRMRPLTEKMPKPLVPVAGKALVDHSLDFVGSGGVTHAVVNASYMREMLAAHLAQRAVPQITVSHEDTPLETGGGIREALPHLGDAPFVSVNSDIICVNRGKHAIHRLRAAWDDEAVDAVLLLHPLGRAFGFSGPGDFFLEDSGEIRRRGTADRAPYVFAGVQLLHPRYFQGCPSHGPFSMNELYNRDMLADGRLSRVRGVVHDGDWLHVGDPAGLAEAEAYLKSNPF